MAIPASSKYPTRASSAAELRSRNAPMILPPEKPSTGALNGFVIDTLVGFGTLVVLWVAIYSAFQRALRNENEKHERTRIFRNDSRHCYERKIAPLLRIYAASFVAFALTPVITILVLSLHHPLGSLEYFVLAIYVCLFSTYGLCVAMGSLNESPFRSTILGSFRPGTQLWFDGDRRLFFEDFASVMFEESMLDQVKRWVEGRVKPFQVNWYPFRYPVKSLSDYEIRIRSVYISWNLEMLVYGER
jgi:hypothetical protein